MKEQQQFQYSARSGFTLVETLVAASIFIVLTTIAVGAFVQALKSQRYLTSLLALENNAGSAMEQVAREVRTGYSFCSDRATITTPCADDDSFILFKNYEGLPTIFELGAVEGHGSILRNGDAITAANVDITDLWFSVYQDVPPGYGATPCAPWRISIYLTAKSTNPDLASRSMHLETTVSSRVLPREAPDVSSEILEMCRPVGD